MICSYQAGFDGYQIEFDSCQIVSDGYQIVFDSYQIVFDRYQIVFDGCWVAQGGPKGDPEGYGTHRRSCGPTKFWILGLPKGSLIFI